jgi:hypothetical protein
MQRLGGFMFVLVLGCGDSAGDPMSGRLDSSQPPTAGSSGSTGGGGGLGGGAAGDGGATGSTTGGADASAAGGAGGAGGAAGTTAGDTGAAREASTPPVDTAAAMQELSELIDGLPAPTTDCRGATGFIIGCVSVSGTLAGTEFDFSCVDDGGLVYVIGQGGGVQCRGELSGRPLNINLQLGPVQPRSEGEFAAATATDDTCLWFDDLENDVQSHRNGIYQLEGTHERRLAVLGSAEITVPRDDLCMEGEFAASYSPRASCTPDADGFGCETVRVRGTFSAFPIVR